MSLLAKKRNGSNFPLLTRDFFNTDRLFSPTIFDFYGDLLNLEEGSSIVPSVNIIETEKNYQLELAAPGLKRDDFKIEVQNDIVTISSEKEEDKKEEGKDFKRREFFYSSFSRSFSLPENCISDKIEAKYENGILKLSLPKKEVTISKPKKEISIQ